jgi:CheY-like chemotaxis protein
MHILVVEDDNLLLRLYKSQIESWQLPLKVAVARNGVEGLILIGLLSPDLLITDLKMPELDGFACCVRLPARRIARVWRS